MTLPSLPPGGPREITIQGSRKMVIQDVLMGEVWLCAGQSNMAWSVAESDGAVETMAAMDNPSLRCFIVKPSVSGAPQEDVEGSWQVCSAQIAAKLSGVAYFFGRELNRKQGTPVGLIQAAWGGTPIEAWMDATALTAVAGREVLPSGDQNRLGKVLSDAGEQRRLLEAWELERDQLFNTLSEEEQAWAGVTFEDSDWAPCPVPGHFDDAVGGFDGVIWYRRAVDVPVEWAGLDLRLHLGAIDDLDRTFWNGVSVGSTGPDTPDYMHHARDYHIPGKLVRPGRNVLAVRVIDEYLTGGFLGLEEDIWLSPANAADSTRVGLAGTWRVRTGQRLGARPMLAGLPQTLPTGVFNAMIAPLVGLNLRGAIWYQGENNVGNAERYRELFPALIRSWRDRWGIGNFPFLFVQLANHGPRRAVPAGSAVAALREAQAVALALPATAMATAIDLGEADDIHPRNKRGVGLRLASAYLDGETQHPIIGEPSRVREGVRIPVASPLSTKDGRAPACFEFTSEDGVRHAAIARIEKDAIIITCPSGLRVTEVRHAWADNPAVNVVTASGLPLLPFRQSIPG